MEIFTLLDIAAITLALIHFGIPLAYYHYLKRWLNRPWNIRTDPGYIPAITVILPTYNEAPLIGEKLDNIYQQDYPRDRLEVTVIDSASTDGTPDAVRKWAMEHPDARLKLIEEPERRGKAAALNVALKHATGEVVVVTDADAYWPSQDTLRRAMEWLSDPAVGAVSCLKKPAGKGPAGVEEEYRRFYNVLRLAESKAWATPVFHGELAAFRKELLLNLGGFPTDVGADDSYTATRIGLMGYRAIMPEDLICVETVPREYSVWRMRRAQHLVQNFLKVLAVGQKTPRQFKTVLYTEAYLHLANPWLLPVAVLLLTVSRSLIGAVMLSAGVVLLAYKPYRMWIATQAYLMAAAVRNLWTKEIVWEKQTKAEQAGEFIE